MHAEAHDFVARVLAEHGPFKTVVEVGALDINGTVRPLFGPGCAYTGVDMVAGRGVDVVADAATWRPDSPPGCVVCCECLEHHPAPAVLVDAMMGMLEPGGRLIITAACDPREPHSAVDGAALREGEHYANVDLDTLDVGGALTGLWVEEHPGRGDLYLTGTVA